ncbi:Cation/calcium exchanger 5 [Acorus gramineus]|uniref:Cation/calcium exchanger 5 n=1 Tax=Acorus gramineus TaxID=55184 RepID=A0AAV9AM11_ACOGR|nr:Cation/calcium exchanger 5 [Acorus gramineus]
MDVVISMFWISTIAVELLDCLARFIKAAPAILGLTVLAWGSSVGDLIAEVAIAKAGQPSMAIEEAEISKIIYHVGVRAMAAFRFAGVENLVEALA